MLTESVQTDIRLLQDQGEVLICGDFNAHTGTEDDTGASAQQLLDELGVPSDQTHVSTLAAPTRVNPDRHAVCQFGQVPVEFMCSDRVCDVEREGTY